jgi:hypothetical protein
MPSTAPRGSTSPEAGAQQNITDTENQDLAGQQEHSRTNKGGQDEEGEEEMRLSLQR